MAVIWAQILTPLNRLSFWAEQGVRLFYLPWLTVTLHIRITPAKIYTIALYKALPFRDWLYTLMNCIPLENVTLIRTTCIFYTWISTAITKTVTANEYLSWWMNTLVKTIYLIQSLLPGIGWSNRLKYKQIIFATESIW